MYAAAAAPPRRARRSPASARAEREKSTPETTSTPVNATTRPRTTPAPNRSPRRICQATTHAIWSDTIAVADATEVSVSAVTQVAKWTASASPDAATRSSCREPSEVSSRRRVESAEGARTTVAIALRQKAMASGGTTMAAIIGPDMETARTPTAISSRVRTRAILLQPIGASVWQARGRDRCVRHRADRGAGQEDRRVLAAVRRRLGKRLPAPGGLAPLVRRRAAPLGRRGGAAAPRHRGRRAGRGLDAQQGERRTAGRLGGLGVRRTPLRRGLGRGHDRARGGPAQPRGPGHGQGRVGRAQRRGPDRPDW